MPSEETRACAEKSIASRVQAFRSGLAATAEQVRGLLAASGEEGGDESVALGSFAAGKIDVDRFANFAKPSAPSLSVEAIAPVKAALDVLQKLLADEDLFRLRVPKGKSLGCNVGQKLGQLGCAFGAARVVALARSGRYDADAHKGLLEKLSFSKWSAAERAAAPGLVVEVSGGDLAAGSLSPYLDGAVKLVLLVDGDAPPAALARLVTPKVFVQQAAEGDSLDAFASFDGVGVAAVSSTAAAKFLHDPRAGDTSAARFTMLEVPEAPKLKRLGALSVGQQHEDLALLGVLTAAPAPGEAEAIAPAPADPAGQLSAWLLSQTDTSNQSS